ncbi:DNA methyltransferase [Gordonia sihwensis]|uniref:DNA methyltransferase n=1 Tax=Gordonia sihwensis TaxID=173559 RepID=UPI003D979C20
MTADGLVHAADVPKELEYDLVAADVSSAPSLDSYLSYLRGTFREARRVLADDGTLWINVPDAYATAAAVGMTGVGARNLIGVPWRLAFGLQEDGWILRNAIVWHKEGPQPHPAGDRSGDRFESRYEHVFFFSKRKRYWSGLAGPDCSAPVGAIVPNLGDYRADGDVWTITPTVVKGVGQCLPRELAERCISAGCKERRDEQSPGVVYDPFAGAGTVGAAAERLSRTFVGVDLDESRLRRTIAGQLAEPPLELAY